MENIQCLKITDCIYQFVIREIPTVRDFNDYIFNDITLVDFYDKLSEPCKVLEPVILKIGNSYDGQLKIARVNTNNLPELVLGYKVTTLPTLLILRDGKLAGKLVGLHSESGIEEWLAGFVPPANQE